MKARKITNNISLLGAIDWNRTLFDALIPLPHGTSYNAYLVKGRQKTASSTPPTPRSRISSWSSLRKFHPWITSSPTTPSRITPARCRW